MNRYLYSLLGQVNSLLGTDMELDYAPQYGGYMLSAVPRKYRFLQNTERVSLKEMSAFLYGVLCGIRAYNF